MGSTLSGVSCTSARACTAVGHYGNSSGSGQTLAEVWNGKWSIQPTPNPAGSSGSELTMVSCTSSSACTAVGGYGDDVGEQLMLAEAWNGSNWKVQRNPNPGTGGSSVAGVSCSSGTCTAVGYYYAANATTGIYAEAWNGTRWSLQTTPVPPGTADSALFGVSCTSASTCTAVGYYSGRSGITVSLALRRQR
jgi:hypothetical protein